MAAKSEWPSEIPVPGTDIKFIFGKQLGKDNSKVFIGTNSETQELVALKYVS